MRQLSHMTPAPNTRKNKATTDSQTRTDPTALPSFCCSMETLLRKMRKGPRCGAPLETSLLDEESRFAHQVLVQLLGVRHPVGVFLAGHVALVEGALLHEVGAT